MSVLIIAGYRFNALLVVAEDPILVTRLKPHQRGVWDEKQVLDLVSIQKVILS